MTATASQTHAAIAGQARVDTVHGSDDRPAAALKRCQRGLRPCTPQAHCCHWHARARLKALAELDPATLLSIRVVGASAWARASLLQDTLCEGIPKFTSSSTREHVHYRAHGLGACTCQRRMSRKSCSRARPGHFASTTRATPSSAAKSMPAQKCLPLPHSTTCRRGTPVQQAASETHLNQGVGMQGAQLGRLDARRAPPKPACARRVYVLETQGRGKQWQSATALLQSVGRLLHACGSSSHISVLTALLLAGRESSSTA